ncbi:thioesterase family protein [Phenylobacterium soli]|nr:thioesterase family protein [Phenylobacterium soli]
METTISHAMPLRAEGPGRWITTAGPEWENPGGGLWGGYPIGLTVRVLEAEAEAVGEPVCLTLTYVDRLPVGELSVRTRRMRQGGSVGVWQVDIGPAGSDEVSVHAVATLARRPPTPDFAFAEMPLLADPETLPAPESPGGRRHFGAQAFERRTTESFPIPPGGDSFSLAWVRPRIAPWDKALIGMVTDNSPPRAFYALGSGVMTTTLSLTVYLHATAAEIAAAGDDYILIECEGRVGGGGASDERSSYWRRDGKLLATSEQLVWYRERRPQVPE